MRILFILALFLLPGLGLAGPLTEREGWEVTPTSHAYAALIDRLKAAVKAEGFAVVTEAGPTEAAKARGVTIPGNRVLGVFRNDYAVRILGLSTAAMIEAPIRFYITETAEGTATLAWKRPSFVMAPYMAEGGADLTAAASELDAAFARIGAAAVAP